MSDFSINPPAKLPGSSENKNQFSLTTENIINSEITKQGITYKTDLTSFSEDQSRNNSLTQISFCENQNFSYPGYPAYSYPYMPQYPGNCFPPIYDDPYYGQPCFSDPSNSSEMRFAYKLALEQNDPYRLLQLTKVENNNNFMSEVKAGDMLKSAKSAGELRRDPNILLHIARYENEANLMTDIKAGDVLRKAYYISQERKDSGVMFNIARFENEVSLMSDIKAGDIMRNAFKTAVTNRDPYTLFKMADYEEEHNLMRDIKAGFIRQEAQRLMYGW